MGDDPLGLVSGSDPLGLATPSKPKVKPKPKTIVDQSPENPHDYATQALGGIASLLRAVPGGTALQAGARSVVRGQPYSEALRDIQGAEDSAPSVVRNTNAIAGSLPGLLASPGSAVQQGIGYGVASGLLAPTGGVGDRLKNAAVQGTVGAVLGKAGELVPMIGRTKTAQSLGSTLLKRKAAMSAATSPLYHAAETEGWNAAANGAMPKSVQEALVAPDIKPYVDAVRASRQFAGADEPTILREAYRHMSDYQRTLGSRMLNAGDFKAGTSLDKADIGLAKQQMTSAADEIMPSFRVANAKNAEHAGQMDAFKLAADATNRIAKGSTVAGKKLATNSPEAFMKAIQKMSPAEARAAKEGLLGRLSDNTGLTGNPFKLFNIPKSAARMNRLAPYLEALDKRMGTQYPSLLRSGAIATGGLLGQ